MTDQRSPLDAHVEAFGAQLSTGVARVERARRRRRRAAAIGVPIIAATSLAVALWPGEQRSVLDRATAALEPTSKVVHYRVETGTNGHMSGKCKAGANDVWQETGANPRWRWRQPELPCATEITGFGNVVAGPMESAYDGHALITSSPAGGWTERLSNPSPRAREVPDFSGIRGLAAQGHAMPDPVTFLRQLLGERRLRVDRRSDLHGHEIFWLSGHDGQGSAVRVAIDARTYAPIEVIRQIPMSTFLKLNPQVAKDEGDEVRTRFLVYEPARPRDLRPELPAHGKEIAMDWKAGMAAMRARAEAESRKGHLLALQMQRERARKRAETR